MMSVCMEVSFFTSLLKPVYPSKVVSRQLPTQMVLIKAVYKMTMLQHLQVQRRFTLLAIPPPHRYYGDLQWYAPDGVDGDKKDTLLIIAVKINNVKLVEWMLSLDGLDATKQNGKGLDAMAVAKALGREHLLLGMAASEAPSDAAESRAKRAGAASELGAPPPPPGKAAPDEAALEIARLANAVKMLKVISDFEFRFLSYARTN